MDEPVMQDMGAMARQASWFTILFLNLDLSLAEQAAHQLVSYAVMRRHAHACSWVATLLLQKGLRVRGVGTCR